MQEGNGPEINDIIFELDKAKLAARGGLASLINHSFLQNLAISTSHIFFTKQLWIVKCSRRFQWNNGPQKQLIFKKYMFKGLTETVLNLHYKELGKSHIVMFAFLTCYCLHVCKETLYKQLPNCDNGTYRLFLFET